MAGGKIFISYRREDTRGYALALHERLRQQFPDRVFKDIASIEPGQVWEDAIGKALDSSDAFIALIGKEWLKVKDESGQRRLDNPKDTLRREIATALKRKVRVISTLVGGASMPSPQDLPPDLQPLTERQALEIIDEYWEDGVKKLISAIEHALDLPAKKGPTRKPFPRAPETHEISPPPVQPLPASLPELLPGNWQIQIAQPLTGQFGQITLELSPQGMFRGQIVLPVGTSIIQGQWRTMPLNQLQLQGLATNPVLGAIPYGAVIQFTEISPNRLAGVSNVGEQLVWQKIG